DSTAVCGLGAGGRACALVRDRRSHQSEFLEPRQFRSHRAGGDDSARPRPRRNVRHSDGVDRPFRGRHTGAERGHPFAARSQRREFQQFRPSGGPAGDVGRRGGRFRQRRRSRRAEGPSFMTTLGTWFIGVGVANALLGGMAVRINDSFIRGLAIERFLGLPWGVWLALICLAIAFVIQNHTRLGRYIYALGGGEELAALSGIPVARVRILTFTLAGVFYSIGGILAAAQLGLGNSLIGAGRLFSTITAVAVGRTALSGGEGSVLQTLVGVLIVAVLNNGMVLADVPPSYQI